MAGRGSWELRLDVGELFRTRVCQSTEEILDVQEIRVSYTPDALRAKVQGGVALEAVVRADGTVGDVRVVRSLDRRYELDDEAVKALKQWQFTPGQKDGVAVPVVVEVEMTFTIGKPR